MATSRRSPPPHAATAISVSAARSVLDIEFLLGCDLPGPSWSDDISATLMHELRSSAALPQALPPYLPRSASFSSSSPTSSRPSAPGSWSTASTPCAAAAAVPRGADRGRPAGRSSPWLGGLARYGMRELLNSGSRRVETDLRDQLYDHLQRMSAEFYDRYPTGDVMARTTNDLLAVRMVAGPALMYLVDTSIRALLIAPAMLAISPRLTLLALLPLLGLPVVMVSLGQRHPPQVSGHSGPVQRAHQPRPREPLRGPGRPGLPPGGRGDRALPGAERGLSLRATWAWRGCRACSFRCSPCWAVSAASSSCTAAADWSWGERFPSASSSPSACTWRCWCGR